MPQGLILPYEDHVPKIAPSAFIAPDATVIGNVEIGANANIWYKCVLRGDVMGIRIGANTNIQDGTVIHVTGGRYDALIGDDVTIGHMVLVHGCTLESGSFVGMRAMVMDGCVIETGAMLAGGAVLTPGKRIPGGQLWAGSPARYMRDLTDDDLANFKRTSSHYVDLGRRHQASIDGVKAVAE